jgi:hypothetical protein
MIDERDKTMMSVSVPVVDYLEMREEIDRLEDAVNRMEKIVECLAELYLKERVKNWEIILQQMVGKEERKKGNRNDRIRRS